MKTKLNLFHSLAALCMVLLMASCASPKEILYLQDVDEHGHLSLKHENTIKKGDRLSILVSGQDKTVTAPYNQTLFEPSVNGVGTSSNPENATIAYLVQDDGCIDFPKLGKLRVEGMTLSNLREFLTEEIKKDVKDATVNISIKNFRVHVLGEVRSPGTYTLDSDKHTTIFQALSYAGDLAISAKRDGVIVLRDENGVQKHYTVDLRKADVFDSPVYFVQQNDVIIVQPSSRRVSGGTMNTQLWSVITSSVTTSIAIATLILSILRK